MEEVARTVIDAIRIAIGLVFLVSALGKIRDVRGFLQGVVAYRVIPAPWSIAYGLAVIPLEFLVGVSFISGWSTTWAAPISLLLLVSFFVAVGLSLRRKRSLPCYCFGTGAGEPVSRRTLARISLLLVGTFVAMLGQRQLPSPLWGDSAMIVDQVSTVFIEGTVALFVLAVGRWVLALPDLLRLRGMSTR